MSRTLFLLLVVVATCAPFASGAQPKYRAPRTESGHPDLQGVWNFNTNIPLQRPAAYADKPFFTKEDVDKRRSEIKNGLAAIAKFAPIEAVGLDWFDNTVLIEDLRSSLITYPANGRLPALVAGVRRLPNIEDVVTLLGDPKGSKISPQQLSAFAAAFLGGRKDSHRDFNMMERCLIGINVPLVPELADNYVQIVQSGDSVALVTDFDRRIIAVDGKPPIGDNVRSWAGISRGRWEGDTLVVVTTNFDGRAPSLAGAGNSRDKVVTERFTRTAANVMQYAATVGYPKTFQDRVELSFAMAMADERIYEGACHEGNYSLRNSLLAARQQDAETKK